MKTRYPIRKSGGKDFSNPEELQDLLRREKHGQWLSSSNGMWHGGIHISRNTAPQSVITPDDNGTAIPLQCVAGGDVVAWRLNQDYYSGKFGDTSLQYSTSFLLVRSVHKPATDSSTWLTFYTLYMHLAPLSCYPKRKVYQVTAQGNGLLMRQYHGNETHGQHMPDVIEKAYLRTGDQFQVERQETFLLSNGHPEVFGLAQKIKNGAAEGGKFWSSVRPSYAEPADEQYANFPAWMSAAVKQGKYDAVVCPSSPITINAGDAVGFLARDDAPGQHGVITTDWFSHIEVISNDGNMPSFLNNPGHLKTGQQYILVKEGQPLYHSEKNGSTRIFQPMKVITTRGDSEKIITYQDASPFKDEAGVMWYQLRPHTWMHQDGVNLVSQHDLSSLKFTALEQEPAQNFKLSLEEKWISSALRWLSGEIWPERDLESKELSVYNSQLADKLDLNRDGKISAMEMEMYRKSIMHGLQHRHPQAAFLLRRLVVKHESEWNGDSAHPKWKSVLEQLSGDWLAYAGEWLDAHEWMSKVPAFSKDEAIWHFHPIEFLDVISLQTLTPEEARVRAFMRMLRVGEGTVGEKGYETLFGGQSFINDYHKDYSNHPGISITRGKLTSTAAGAYQVMGYTWNDPGMVKRRKQYGILDFSPESQDKFCVLIFKYKRKKSLERIMAGEITQALDQLSYEWASLPPGRYGQPAKSMAEAMRLYDMYLAEEMTGKSDLHLSIGYIDDINKD